MDINRVIFDFSVLLTNRTNYLTEDSVRYCLFSCMLRQDGEIDHYTMEMPYYLMKQLTNERVIASTETLKAPSGIVRQELDLLYDDGENDIICIEIKFHRHVDLQQRKKESAYAHTDAAGRIINDMRRLALIKAGKDRVVRRLFIYVTDDEMNNYLSNNNGPKENEQYRKGLAAFYLNGGTFDCKSNGGTPKTFVEAANSSFNAVQAPFTVTTTKLLNITACQLNCSSFQNGNCYISLFEINGSEMSIFDQKPIEQHVRALDETIQNQLAMCYVGVTILETSDPEAVAKHLEKMVSSDYQVIGNEPEAEMLKKQQGRPVYRWDAKTFKKYDAIGSMYQLSKLPKEPKPIVIIENIADIPDRDRNIYDDPALVENILLHSWKDETIHLPHHKNGPFQMSKCDYTVIFPVKPGDLQKLRHSIKSDGFGFVQF